MIQVEKFEFSNIKYQKIPPNWTQSKPQYLSIINLCAGFPDSMLHIPVSDQCIERISNVCVCMRYPSCRASSPEKSVCLNQENARNVALWTYLVWFSELTLGCAIMRSKFDLDLCKISCRYSLLQDQDQFKNKKQLICKKVKVSMFKGTVSVISSDPL